CAWIGGGHRSDPGKGAWWCRGRRRAGGAAGRRYREPARCNGWRGELMAIKGRAVIPTYNCARYLGDAIRSVLRQTLRLHAVIVIDDGSTDNTREVVGQFGPKVTYICQRNRGPSGSRNTGIAAATGDWIAFLDHDDLWLPHKNETQVLAIEQHPECDLVYCGWHFWQPPATLRVNIPALGAELREGLFWQTTFLPSGVMIRRAVLTGIGGFDERMPVAHDWDLWLRLEHKSPGRLYGVDQ